MSKKLNHNQPSLATGLAIAIGEFNDTSSIDKFGYNPSVGSSYETIWDQGGTYAYLASAQQLTVTSAAGASDDGVEVSIQGLDANWELQTVTVTLGATGVATTTETFRRVFRAFVSNGQDATGDIDISYDGVTYAYIETEFQQTMMAVYTVPAGKTAYIVSGNISGLKDKDVTGKLMIRREGGVFRAAGLIMTSGAAFQRQWVIPQSVPEKTDIEIRAKAGATGPVGAGFEIILVDN